MYFIIHVFFIRTIYSLSKQSVILNLSVTFTVNIVPLNSVTMLYNRSFLLIPIWMKFAVLWQTWPQIHPLLMSLYLKCSFGGSSMLGFVFHVLCQSLSFNWFSGLIALKFPLCYGCSHLISKCVQVSSSFRLSFSFSLD